MSNILKGLILDNIRDLNDDSDTTDAELQKFAGAIADAVQQYINSNVTVIAGQTVTVATTGTAVAQRGTGTTTTPGTLRAL